MSDENPPPLRLKARLKPDPLTSAPIAEGTPESVAPSSPEAGPDTRPRSKPRLTAEPEAAVVRPAPPPVVLFKETEAAPQPDSPQLSAVPGSAIAPEPPPGHPAGLGDASKFKLKGRETTPLAASSPPPAPRSTPEAAPEPAPELTPPAVASTPPPAPVIPALVPLFAPPLDTKPAEPTSAGSDGVAKKPGLVLKPIHIKALEPTHPLPRKRPEHGWGFRLGVVTVGLFALTALAAGGFLAYQRFVVASKDPEPAVRSGPEAGGQVPSTPGTVSTAPTGGAPTVPSEPSPPGPRPAVTLPGKFLEKTREVVAAHRAASKDQVDAILEGRDPSEPKTTVAAAKPTPVVPKEPEPTPVVLRGDVIPSGNVSIEFLAFAQECRVAGVFQGNPPRALLNGRTFKVGQVVEPTLGIVFAGIDADQKHVWFKDASGAIVRKKY